MIDIRPHDRLAPYHDLGRIVLACGLALAVLYAFFADDRTDFNQIGLGTDGLSVYAERDGIRVHCASPTESPLCLPTPTAPKRAIWLGASQLHVIMRAGQGDRTAPDLLADALRAGDVDLRTYSVGNANLQEMLLMFEAARRAGPIDVLLLALVYDDLKEEELHPNETVALTDPRLVERLQETVTGRNIVEQLAALKARLETTNAAAPRISAPKAENGATESSLQTRVENTITGWLYERSVLWRLREAVRGHLQIAAVRGHDQLMALRYTLLGQQIPLSYVAIPSAVRERNWNALHDIAVRAKTSGTRLIAYIAPRPRDVFFPYEPQAYAAFKQDSRRIVETLGGLFLDLEDAIADDEVWGTIYNGKGGRAKDIFHFDARGHRLLADALGQTFGQLGRP